MGLKRKVKYLFIVLTVLALIITAIFIFLFERYAMPIAEELVRQYAVTEINTSINKAVKNTAQEKNISAEDLYTVHFDTSGKINYIEVDSMLINSVCADTAQMLSGDLNAMPVQAVELPLGTLTGINLFAHTGPCIPLYLSPAGSASADYETAIESAGIGQVNFKVWLVINTDIAIVNPLMNRRISITRKLMLVNTVFSGEVPSAFYGIR